MVKNVPSFLSAGGRIPVLLGSDIGVIFLTVKYAKSTSLRGKKRVPARHTVFDILVFQALETYRQLFPMGGVSIVQTNIRLNGVDPGIGYLCEIGAGVVDDERLRSLLGQSGSSPICAQGPSYDEKDCY